MAKEILVTQSSMPALDEYIAEIHDIWDSKWLTNMGAKHKRLQSELEDYLAVENIDLLTNGHMALELTMQAMKLSGEVITTPFTFASTTHAIVRNGLTPVFCDINPYDYNIDADKIESLITEKTCAIVPVHVYGNICDVEKIQKIADKHNLKVIYDAAHAFGVKYKGRGIGTFGDASCFSFHATKVFNSIEGGAVCFSDLRLGEAIYNLKNFGIRGPESVCGIGANAKMNEFCAAMGLCNLRHIDEEIQKRKNIVLRYRAKLSGIKGIQLVTPQEEVDSNYSYFPVVFHPSEFGKTRDEVFKALQDENIFARKYFYPIASEFECYRDEYDSFLTPVALEISNKVLTLPLYADLSLDDVDRICDIILR